MYKRVGGQIENEHKKHKKPRHKQIAMEYFSAKGGQFIFLCNINFLPRLIFFSLFFVSFLYFIVFTLSWIFIDSHHPQFTFSIVLFHHWACVHVYVCRWMDEFISLLSFKTVNSSRHQGEYELANHLRSTMEITIKSSIHFSYDSSMSFICICIIFIPRCMYNLYFFYSHLDK